MKKNDELKKEDMRSELKISRARFLITQLNSNDKHINYSTYASNMDA